MTKSISTHYNASIRTFTDRITRNTVKGTNTTRSSYSVTGNLTIPANTTLKLVNTVLDFTFSSGRTAHLYDNGTLELYNSEIVMSRGPSESNDLLVDVNGTGTSRANLDLYSSSIGINGSLRSDFGKIEMWNSSLSGIANGTSHIETSFSHSLVLLYHSTLEGYRNRRPLNEYSAGTETRNKYYSQIGYPALTGSIEDSGKSLINEVSVKITYSGTTPSNESYALFNISGEPAYRYYFEGTGSSSNRTTVNFSFPVSGRLQTVYSLIDGGNFTAYFSQVPYVSTLTFFSIDVNFLSNDTVSYYGEQSFGPVLNETSFYSVCSGMQLNYAGKYIYTNVLNPEKNTVFLYNSSKFYGVGAETAGSLNSTISSPFSVHDSWVRLFTLQKIFDAAPEGPLNNTLNRVSPDNINPGSNVYASELNSAILRNLSSLGIGYQNTSSDGLVEIPLLRMVDNVSGSTYYGNYEDTVDSQTTYFSESASNVVIGAEKNVTARLDLPEIEGNVTFSPMVSGRSLNFSIDASSMYYASQNVTLYLNLTDSASSFSLFRVTVNLSANRTYDFLKTTQVPNSTPAGSYVATLSYTSGSYEYNENNVLYRKSEIMHSDVNLTTSVSYTWEKSPVSVSLEANISNSGSQSSGKMAVVAVFYHDSDVIGHSSYCITVGGQSKVTQYMEFNASTSITGAAISLKTEAGVIPYNTSGENVTVSFTPVHAEHGQRYTLTVYETGLPRNDAWSFSVNNTDYYSSTAYLNISVYSGNATLDFSPVTGYHPSVMLINVRVTANESVHAVYLQDHYTASFHAAGSVPGGGWAVNINGHTYVASGRQVGINLTDGTYRYTVTEPVGYTLKHTSGTLTVDGSNTSVTLDFSKTGHLNLLGKLTAGVLEYSPAVAVVSSLTGIWLYRVYSQSVYLCQKCGRTLLSRSEKCQCGNPGKKGKPRRKKIK